MSAEEKERLPSNRHIDTFRRRRVIRDTENAISELRLERICRSPFCRIVKIGILARTEEKISWKTLANRVGRTSASAEVITTVSWRSRRQLHQERKAIAE